MMGGSGGGQSYVSPETDIDELRARVKGELAAQRVMAELDEFLSEYLVNFNSRDVRLVNDRLEQLADAFEELDFELDRFLFGGSVAKHTYVDGISDVDSLVIFRRETIGNETPGAIRQLLADAIRERLPARDVVDVDVGSLAVSVTYRDNNQIQLLPALEVMGQIHISSENGSSWRQIDPKAFARRLSSVNRDAGYGVIPTIKLAKAILANRPEDQRLSGYHVEALAVSAFENYEGARNRASMLTHFFRRASSDVLAPIPDLTGQSPQIDAYLGPSGGPARRKLSDVLNRIANQMVSSQRVHAWQGLFGE